MRIFENFDLTNYNSYRLKANCSNAFFPDEEKDIQDIFLNRKDRKKIIIGDGNNIIFSEEYYDADFIIFSKCLDAVSWVDEVTFEAGAGTTLLQLSEMALEKSLSGLEMFYDIPSSLGGAVVMNAGAGGEDIKSLLISVRYYDPVENVFADITKDEIGFEYRNSFFQKNPHLIILKAVLQLKPGQREAIKEKMDTIKTARWAKQPKEFPNAGSVFKRPPGRFVGPMMEELNLKGFGVGGAKISEKHGGFIINYNGATGKDILDLIGEAKLRVHERFGVDLEIEQRII